MSFASARNLIIISLVGRGLLVRWLTYDIEFFRSLASFLIYARITVRDIWDHILNTLDIPRYRIVAEPPYLPWDGSIIGTITNLYPQNGHFLFTFITSFRSFMPYSRGSGSYSSESDGRS